ncbi:MAG: sigma 54-interacting transcriptional regulator [Phycisphaerales bacterium]|nr:sigma 54-interacting transcriptional regulator [Phycisphaerales bacterium]
MDLVVFGILGTTLDRGEGSFRWQNWRPTVSLFQHEELLIRRLELLCDPKFEPLAAQVVADIADVSPETTVRTHEMTFRDAWDFEEVYGKLHDFARAYPFATDREQYLCHITTGTHVAQICMFLLTESRHIPGRLIQTGPPHHRERGDPPRYSIIDLDRSKYDRIAARFAREQREAAAFLKAGIETRSAAFNRMIDEIEHVAIHSRAPILLTGPTGAGKSSLARRIHDLRKTRHEVAGKFVEVNCATIRGDGAMSALFGHKRGAFTGATSDRPGLLREANGGTLFLDEIGELRLDEQAMLLRAVEEGRFLPLGSDRESESDFLLICGTNRDLAAAIRAGSFRDDLLARINLWTFELPGLAARREDIEPNIRYELEQLEARAGRAFRFNTEALERFMAFATSDEAPWKGNFRDLNAAVARMATMSPTGRINEDTVSGEIARLRRAWSAGAPSGEAAATDSTSKSMDRLRSLLGSEFDAVDEFDRVQLAHVVDVCRLSRSLSAAGRRLFAVSREKKRAVNDADRLRKYLARFGLHWDALVQ